MKTQAKRRIAGFGLAILLAAGGGAPHLFSQTRTLGLRIFGDEEMRRDRGWKTKTADLIASIAAVFERDFGIRFLMAGPEEWVSNNETKSLSALALDLETRFGDDKNPEILLALTAQSKLEAGLVGYALFKEGVLIARASGSRPALERIIKHELGHLFGAVHVADSKSVMSPFRQGNVFDDGNARLISLHRDRRFRSNEEPLPKIFWPEAIDLYERIERANSQSGSRLAIPSPGSPSRNKEVSTEADILTFVGPLGNRENYGFSDVSARLAKLDLESGRLDRVIEKSRALIALDPGNTEIRCLLGIAYRKQGFFDKSVEVYRGILRDEPENSSIHYNLGIGLGSLGKLAEAESAYRRALELKPKFAEARNNLGETLLRQGRPAEAEAEFHKALAISMEFPWAHANLAELLFRKNDLEGASREAEKAVSLNPDLPEPYNLLGNIHHARGRFDEAARMYQEAISRNPRYAAAYFNLGIVGLNQTRVGEAKGHFAKALEIDPTMAEAYAGLGTCLIRENKAEEAIAAIQRAQALGHRSAQTHINLGLAYLRKGLNDQAAAEAALAVALDPNQAAAYNLLGQVYLQQGLKTKASEQFLKAREIKERKK